MIIIEIVASIATKRVRRDLMDDRFDSNPGIQAEDVGQENRRIRERGRNDRNISDTICRIEGKVGSSKVNNSMYTADLTTMHLSHRSHCGHCNVEALFHVPLHLR